MRTLCSDGLCMVLLATDFSDAVGLGTPDMS